MAILKANNTTALNATGSWVGGVIPTATDIAQWDSTVVAANGVSVTGTLSFLGLLITNPGGSVTIGSGGALTLNASGINLSTATQNLNINNPVTLALGDNQTWTVASGRTLTVTSTISGAAKNVIFSGAGTTVLNTGINTSWTSSTLTVSSGAFVQASANRVLGATTNTVTVQSGGALYCLSLSPVSVTNISVAGSGVSGKQAGAFYLAGAGDFVASKTITLTGASPVIGLLSSSQAGVIAGSPTGDVTFNMFGAANDATLTTQQTFTVASGSYLVLQGVNPVGAGTPTVADFGLSASDALPFGTAGNAVKVRSTARLTNVGATTDSITLSRNYFFDGESTYAPPVAPNGYTLYPSAILNTGFTFTGTLTATAGNWVKASNNGGVAVHYIQFGSAAGGKLDGSGGAWHIRSFSTAQTIRFHSNLDISTWSGDISVNGVSYGVAPTGAATWAGNNTVDNIKGSALTLAHSSLSIGIGTVTFTGTDDLSTGSTPITTTGSLTFSTLAKRLTIPGDIAGSGVLSKSSAGTLTLSGNNTGFTAFSHQAGTLELNSSGSAGPVGATFTFATSGTIIDSTTGATLTAAGVVSLGALVGGFTWNGTNNLTFPGIVTHGGSRTVTFVNGATGILTFAGTLNSTTATYLWNVGGGVAGAKNVLYIANTNASLATTGQVTAGYLRAGNATSLGSESVVGSVTWTVSSGAAIELINGITVSAKKNFNGVGTGPNLDGALRSVSGVNKWQGQISITTATGARIQVDAGTFTLDPTGSPAYTGIDAPAGTNTTPITFTALSGAVLNQDRILAAGFSTVTIGNGSGTVVLSKANLHSGAMTCSAGTTKLTNIAAVGAGAGNSVTVTAGATMESAVKAVFPAALTLGSSGSVATFKISV